MCILNNRCWLCGKKRTSNFPIYKTKQGIYCKDCLKVMIGVFQNILNYYEEDLNDYKEE